MDYRDGICALTHEQSKGCIVLAAGVVLNNREVLLSEAGVDELSNILDNPDAHWQTAICGMTGEESECVAIWGRLAPKKSIMISRAGIDALKGAIKSRPADYAEKAVEAIKKVAKAVATTPIPPEPAPIPEPPPAEEVPITKKKVKELAELRVDREVAEMNLEEAEQALADMQQGDDETPLKSAVEVARKKLEEAKTAEEAAQA